MKPSQTPFDLYQDASETFAPAMQRLARATEANDANRHDLLQDMHLQLWRSFEHFDHRCSLKTWVYRVIHNVAATHVDRERRRSAEQFNLSELDEIPDFADMTLRLERGDALTKLHAWIRRLATADRQVLTLYLEGLSAAEMSDITGRKAGAIATRISRLKSKLTRDFKEASK